MEIHGYTANGLIDATIDGVRMNIPDTGHDRERWGITAALAEGTVIPPYVPPPQKSIGEIDQDTLNAALAAEGSVVRALALVLLQEINTIRQRLPVPLPAYTPAQLVAALKAKMR